MSIYPAFNVRNRNFPAVTDNAAQNSDNMPVSNTIFLVTAVIPTDNVVIFTHFKDTVQNILTAVSLIQGDVITLQPAIDCGNDKNIPPLLYQRHHAVADISVYYPPCPLHSSSKVELSSIAPMLFSELIILSTS